MQGLFDRNQRWLITEIFVYSISMERLIANFSADSRYLTVGITYMKWDFYSSDHFEWIIIVKMRSSMRFNQRWLITEIITNSISIGG